MHHVLRLFVAALAAVVLACVGGIVSAQDPVKQIKLTEKQVEGFIASHKDMWAADPSQIDAVAKQFGFKDQGEYEDVVNNIVMVMDGIDRKTKEFTDAPARLKKEIDDLMANTSLPEKDRKRLVESLTEHLKSVEPIMHPSNVELVMTHFDTIAELY